MYVYNTYMHVFVYVYDTHTYPEGRDRVKMMDWYCSAVGICMYVMYICMYVIRNVHTHAQYVQMDARNE